MQQPGCQGALPGERLDTEKACHAHGQKRPKAKLPSPLQVSSSNQAEWRPAAPCGLAAVEQEVSHCSRPQRLTSQIRKEAPYTPLFSSLEIIRTPEHLKMHTPHGKASFCGLLACSDWPICRATTPSRAKWLPHPLLPGADGGGADSAKLLHTMESLALWGGQAQTQGPRTLQ